MCAKRAEEAAEHDAENGHYGTLQSVCAILSYLSSPFSLFSSQEAINRTPPLLPSYGPGQSFFLLKGIFFLPLLLVGSSGSEFL